MNLTNFLYKNFLEGWKTPQQYTIFDTLAYIILALIIVYYSYKFLKNKIKFNHKTVEKTVLFILLGSIIRVYSDKGIYPRNFWTVTPGIWIIFFTLIITLLIIDEKLKAEGKVINIIALMGIILHIPYFEIKNLNALLIFTPVYLAIIIPFIYAYFKKWWIFNNHLNLYCILAHMVDGVSSFVNVDFFNYIEIHIVGGMLSKAFNTGFVMIPLKIIVLLPVLYYLDKEEDEMNNYLKIIICALGLGPGLRNLVTVILGV